MEFDYIQVLGFNEKHQKVNRVVPWINITIFNPKSPQKSIDAYCLVDSGSDTTFFTYEIGEYLGIDIPTGKMSLTYGVGGGCIKVFYHNVGIRIEDPKGRQKIIEYEDIIGFTKSDFPNTFPQQTGILGSMGFFRNVKVTLDYPKSIIIGKKLQYTIN